MKYEPPVVVFNYDRRFLYLKQAKILYLRDNVTEAVQYMFYS